MKAPVKLATMMVAMALLTSTSLGQEVRLETLASPAFSADDNAETEELSYNLYLPADYKPDAGTR